MSPLPDPNPWLQYGALGLLGLVLLALIGLSAIGIRWLGKFFDRISLALERVPEALGDVKEELVKANTQLSSIERRDEAFRHKLDSLPQDIYELNRKRTPVGLPSQEPHVTRHPTTRIPRERLQTLISESERRPGTYSVKGKP